MTGFLAPYNEDGTGPVRPWTGNHTMECNNSARGGARVDTGCMLACYCPCHEGWKSRAERATEARNVFDAAVQAERQHQIEKGYTPEHDDEHGIDHLLMWAQEYAHRGEPVKSAALIEAAREKIIRDRDAAPASLVVESRDTLAAAMDPDAFGQDFTMIGPTNLWRLGIERRREAVYAHADALLANGTVRVAGQPVVDREAVRLVIRETRVLTYLSRRGGAERRFDTDAEDRLIDALLASGIFSDAARVRADAFEQAAQIADAVRGKAALSTSAATASHIAAAIRRAGGEPR